MAGRGGQPNFRTDVNRMKTQKWVQASKANYGGDDWGGYDDYDDYEDEPPPPPKPTGLRQRGQGTATSSPDQPNFPTNQQAGAARTSVPSTQSSRPSSNAQPPLRRAGSFEAGDDSHGFKADPPHPVQPTQPAQRAQSPRSPQSSFPPTMAAPSQPQQSFTASQSAPSPSQSPRPSQRAVDMRDERRPSAGNLRQPPRDMPPQQPSAPRSPPVMQGPYMGPGSASRPPHPNQPPPRGDSRGDPRGPPPMGRPPQQGPGPMPPYGAPRPYGPGRGPNGTPPGQDPYSRREHTPPGAPGPPGSQRPRQPPPHEYGPRKRPSQEFGPGSRHSPSQEFRSRTSPQQDFRPRKSPSQEFRPRQSPSQEFRPPPRKESLAGARRPSIPSLQNDALQEDAPRPPSRSPDRRPSPNAAVNEPDEARPSASFVRPSDIYRRMTMEKEKERQSMDSGRPSLDSLDRPVGLSRPSGPVSRNSQDSTRDGATGGLLKPTLDPVAERKSEYGMDGFLAQDPNFARALGSHITAEAPRGDAPSLPQFERFSSFGMDDIMGGNKRASNMPRPAEAEPRAEEESVPATLGPAAATQGIRPDELQHQPSLGFRSAVDRAFEDEHDRSTLSPISGRDSQRSKTNSDMSRSNTTDSAAGISPIMSRVPSAATAEKRLAEGGKVAAPEAIEEESVTSGSPDSRPASSSTLKGPQHPGHSRNASTDSASLPAGYRRSMRPPSPNAIPARLTATSARKAVDPHSQEAEFGVTTPVDRNPSGRSVMQDPQVSDRSMRESDLADAANASSRAPPLEGQTPPLASAETSAQNTFMVTHRPHHGPGVSTDSIKQAESPASRSASPSKGRVRDLATKFNDIHHGSRPSSPSGSVASWASSNKASPEETSAPEIIAPAGPTSHAADKSDKPINEPRKKSVDQTLARPSLPGGWVSHQPSETSDAHSIAPSSDGNYESATEHEQERPSSRLATPKANRQYSSESVDLAPTTVKQPLAGKTFPESAQNPMAALAAAGSALADSVKQMTGVGEGDFADKHEYGDMNRARSGTDETTRPTPLSPDELTTSASSVAPTPLMKDMPQDYRSNRSSGYFPPTALNIRKGEQAAEASAKPDVREPISAASGTSTNMSLDPSSEDTEADKLRKDIARSLSPPDSGLAPINERQSAVSSVFPHEYESYWANQEQQGISPQTTRSEVAPPADSATPAGKRSSLGAGAVPAQSGRESFDKPEPGSERDRLSSAQAPKSSSDSSRPRDSITGPAELDSTSRGMHEVSPLPESSPEPVEMAADEVPAKPRESTDKALPSAPKTGRRRADTATGENQPKPPSFRDIMNIKGQRERISAFSSARGQFGTQETGLNDWIGFMVQKHPEHAKAVSAPMRPVVQTSGIAGSVRKNLPPGIAKIGRSGTVTTPTSASPSSSQVQGSPSVSKRQDFLHQANAFGGKASQGAKGLFAKGKSRFRGVSSEKEKEPSPSRPTDKRSHAMPSPLRRQSLPKDVSSTESSPAPMPMPDSQPRSLEQEKAHRSLSGQDPSQPEQIGRIDSSSFPARSTHSQGPMHSDARVETPANVAQSSHSQDGLSGSSPAIIEPPTSTPSPRENFTAQNSNRSSQSAQESRSRPHSSHVSVPSFAPTSLQQAMPTGQPEIIEGPYIPHTARQSTDATRSETTVVRPDYSTEKMSVLPTPDTENFGVRGFAMWGGTDVNSQPRLEAAQAATQNADRESIAPQIDEPLTSTMPAPTPQESQQKAERNASLSQLNTPVVPAAPSRPSLGNGPLQSQPYAYWRHSHDNINSPWSQRRPSEPSPLRKSTDRNDEPMPDEVRPTLPSLTHEPDETEPVSRRSGDLKPPPPLGRQQTDWSGSSLAVPSDGLPQVPTGNRFSFLQKQRQTYPTPPRQPSPPKRQLSVEPNAPAYGNDKASAHAYTAGPDAMPASNPIQLGERHYARKDSGPSAEPTNSPIGYEADRPPIPMKSRNRLTKRHSTPAGARTPPPQEEEPPKPQKKKRSSMLGTILRRSETPKAASPKAATAKVAEPARQSTNKLRKSDSKKKLAEPRPYEIPPVPTFTNPTAYPRPPSPTSSLPRPPSAMPHLPSLDTNVAWERHQAMSPEKSGPNSGLQEYAGYYGPAQGQTPTFEATSPVGYQVSPRTDSIRGHISYLQSQDMFGRRRQHMFTQSPTQEPGYTSPVSHSDTTASGNESHPQRHQPQRIPSDSSSVYTGIDDTLAAHPSNASSRYGAAGDYGAQRRTRPLTQAYAQYSRNPYDDAMEENQAMSRAGSGRHASLPAGQSMNYTDYAPMPQQAMPMQQSGQTGLAQMYADARRPR